MVLCFVFLFPAFICDDDSGGTYARIHRTRPEGATVMLNEYNSSRHLSALHPEHGSMSQEKSHQSMAGSQTPHKPRRSRYVGGVWRRSPLSRSAQSLVATHIKII